MKKIQLALTLLVLASFPAFAEVEKADTLEFTIAGVPGGLISGEQVNFFQSVLTPEPSNFPVIGVYVNLKYFPINNLGIDFGSNLGSVVSASTGDGSKLAVLDFSDVRLGLIGRIPINFNGKPFLTLNGEFGGLMNFPTYDSNFTAKVPAGYSLYSLQPQLGYYWSVGMYEYYMKPFIVGLSFEYCQENGYVSQTSKLFDGGYFRVPISFGFCL